MPSGGGQQELAELDERVRMQCARMKGFWTREEGTFVPLGASEGGAEAIGAIPSLPLNLGMWQHFFVANKVMTKERREGRRSMSGGKGRTTPLRGGRF